MRPRFLFVGLSIVSLILHLNSNYEVTRDLGDHICDLAGYTMIECTTAEGEVKGEYGEIIKLFNSMIFELNDSN
jgi:hypothetical protein